MLLLPSPPPALPRSLAGAVEENGGREGGWGRRRRRQRELLSRAGVESPSRERRRLRAAVKDSRGEWEARKHKKG